MFLTGSLFSYKVYKFTGGLASAVHVNFTVIPAHTLLEVSLVRITFSGGSVKQKPRVYEEINQQHN